MICVFIICGSPKVIYGDAGNRTCNPCRRGVKKKLFVAFPWVVTSTGPGGFMICVFIL